MNGYNTRILKFHAFSIANLSPKTFYFFFLFKKLYFSNDDNK